MDSGRSYIDWLRDQKGHGEHGVDSNLALYGYHAVMRFDDEHSPNPIQGPVCVAIGFHRHDRGAPKCAFAPRPLSLSILSA
jgi:hypothetical protein